MVRTTSMNESWDVCQGDYNRYARRRDRELVIGSSWRGNAHTDNAGTCTLVEFLARGAQSRCSAGAAHRGCPDRLDHPGVLRLSEARGIRADRRVGTSSAKI